VNYYYSIDGSEVVGPYSLEDLKADFLSGALQRTTQVCAEGTQNWVPLGSLLGAKPVRASAYPQDDDVGSFIPAPAKAAAKIPYAVKVLTTKDRFFSGKFDPEKLEAALNSYAAQGWSVAGCDSAEFPGFLSTRSELITVMHRTEGRMKQYKILTQKDRFFSGKFDPEKLENAINSYVPEGWQVRAVTTATFPGFGSNREEMIVVLEREV
jgi:hypothetical protein